jgi:23S rRNA pseudouridine1911/1915/1917 synthase
VESQYRSLPLPDGLAGSRVDQALARLFGLSRSAAVRVIEAGGVTVDGTVVDKAARLNAGVWLEVVLPEPAPPAEFAIPEAVPGLEVLYSDEHLVVISKPVGVAAHPSLGWTGPTVTAGLAALGHQLASGGPPERQGIVHRLDVGTTGVMVVAKSERAYSQLKRAFAERTVDKRYHALVQGHPDPMSGTVDAPIDRHPAKDAIFAVVAGGKPSVTHYETLEAFPVVTLLEIGLETGRTHQIRVHMSALRHPCAGDLTYGADPKLAAKLGLARQWLHARQLSFSHPATGERVSFTADYPDDLANTLAIVRREA